MPFKIYMAEITRLGDPAIIIVTAFKNAGGYPRAESFVILPRNARTIAQHYSFDVKGFAEPPITLDDDFMFETALAQAKHQFEQVLDERYSKSQWLRPPGTITELGINLLVHARVRGYGEGLNFVLDFTQFPELSGILDPILSLPTVKSAPLGEK